MTYHARIPVILVVAAVFTLSACGGSSTSDTSETKADSVPSASTATDAPVEDANDELPLDEYCALAVQLNHIDVSDEDPDPAEVKKFIAVAEQLQGAAPGEIRDQAKTYFGALIDLAQQGKSADLESMPKNMQDAFGEVVQFSMQHCDQS